MRTRYLLLLLKRAAVATDYHATYACSIFDAFASRSYAAPLALMLMPVCRHGALCR